MKKFKHNKTLFAAVLLFFLATSVYAVSPKVVKTASAKGRTSRTMRSPRVLLQKAIYAEETEGDLDKAIELYQQTIDRAGRIQRIAAQATYQLAMCYLKKGEKKKAAEYLGLVSNYPTQKAIVEKAKQQLKELKPEKVDSVFEQTSYQVLMFMADKYGKLAAEAGDKSLFCNAHIYYVDSDLAVYSGGLGYHYNWTAHSLTGKVKLAGTSYPNQTLYDTNGQKLNTEIVEDEKSKGFYHIYWIPEEPLKPQEALYYGWSKNDKRKLSPLPGSGKGILTMQNQYGPKVLETFFLVLPGELAIAQDAAPTDSHDFGDYKVFWWTKEVPQNTNHSENVTIQRKSERVVFIPDADTKNVGVVLDFASGKLLPAGTGEQQLIGVFSKLGKGDLAYDRVLICLRGAKAYRVVHDIRGVHLVSLKCLEAKDDVAAYELQIGHIPGRYLVTTGDGEDYEINILSADKTGIRLGYKKAKPKIENARTVVESFLSAVIAGNNGNAIKLVKPGSAVDQQVGDLQELCQGRQIQITTVHANDRIALAFTNEFTGDDGEVAMLEFTLTRQRGIWMVEDIDLENTAKAKADLSDFLKNNPDAGEVSTQISGKITDPKESGKIVFLPDADDVIQQGKAAVVLDLKTGKMMTGDKDKQYFNKLNKGDVAYFDDEGEDLLVCFRGAKITRKTANGKYSDTPDQSHTDNTIHIYIINKTPAEWTITTKEGDIYDLKVLSLDNDQAKIKYRYMTGLSNTKRINLVSVSKQDKLAAEVLIGQGVAKLAKRKHDEAEEKFEEAIEKDTTNDRAYQLLGWSQLNHGKKYSAEITFKKCIELNPENSIALNGLGWIAHDKGNIDEAIEWWEKAIKVSKVHSPSLLKGLTQVYMERNQYDKAIKYYKMWLKVQPGNKQIKEGLEKARKNREEVLEKAKSRIDLSSPQATIKSFVKAVYEGNLEAAGECVSKDGFDYKNFKEMLTTESKSNHPFLAMIKAMDVSVPIEITGKSIKDGECKISWYLTLGRVYYFGETKMKKGMHQEFSSYLELVGDKWLIRDI